MTHQTPTPAVRPAPISEPADDTWKPIGEVTARVIEQARRAREARDA